MLYSNYSLKGIHFQSKDFDATYWNIAFGDTILLNPLEHTLSLDKSVHAPDAVPRLSELSKQIVLLIQRFYLRSVVSCSFH